VQVEGQFGGTVGQTSVSGDYASLSNSFENLVSGSEQDAGTVTFANTSGPMPDSSGPLLGSTMISLAGSYSCAAPLSALPEGTCLATGATSSGTFFAFGGAGVVVSGAYSTVWSVPSLTTTTTVTGSVNG